MTKESEILRAAAAILSKPRSWTQTAFARRANPFGPVVGLHEFWDIDALGPDVCYCLSGAVRKAILDARPAHRRGKMFLFTDEAVAERNAISCVADVIPVYTGMTDDSAEERVWNFNDYIGQTREQVVEVLDAAARKCEEGPK